MRILRAADLFCGFGGFRLALDRNGFHSVFACDISPQAAKQYLANFGEFPDGDIRETNAAEIPDHDLLCAGFPCPTFSRSGISKLNSQGRASGLEDFERGQLFFEIVRVLESKRPAGILLENVDNILTHDEGRTIAIIKDRLEALGYHLHARIINAVHWVPQNRSRAFIFGFREEDVLNRTLASIDSLQPHLFQKPAQKKLGSVLCADVPEKYTLTAGTWSYLQKHKELHAHAGHGFGYTLADLAAPARTLTARYYKDGSEVLIPQAGKRPRMLTPRESARLMGFPDSYEIVVPDRYAWQGFGNSVVFPLVSDLLSAVKDGFLRITDSHPVGIGSHKTP